MAKAENSRTLVRYYAGRTLINTVQWGNENGTYRMFALITLLPLTDAEDMVRFPAYGFAATPATLWQQVRNAENVAKAYVDALTTDPMDSFFKGLGYVEATAAQDVDDFWEFSEFDYVTGGNPRP